MNRHDQLLMLIEDDRETVQALADVLALHRGPRPRSIPLRRCADAHLALRSRFQIIPRCTTCGTFGAMPPVVAGVAFCAECWDASHDDVDDPYRDTGVVD